MAARSSSTCSVSVSIGNGSSGSSRAAGKIERAHQLYREGRYTEALGFYTEAFSMAKIKKQKIALHSNRAACYLKLQLFRKVADECTAVLELDHQHTGALMLRTQTFVTLKEYQSALFDASILMEMNPSSEVYRNLQARLKTQLSLPPIPESEEETFYEDEQANDDNNLERKVPAKDLARGIEVPKVMIEGKSCSDNIQIVAGKKIQEERAEPPTKMAEGELVGVFSEKQESALAKKATIMQVTKLDKPLDLQSHKNESAMGVNVKKDGGEAQDSQDKKNNFSVASEVSKVKKKDIDKSMDVQGNKSQFSKSMEANIVLEKAMRMSADSSHKKSESVAKEVYGVQKGSVDNSAASPNNGSIVAEVNVVPRRNADNFKGSIQKQSNGSTTGKEANMLRRNDGTNSKFVQKKGWETIPKPKGHSVLDYSRWDSVESDSSEGEGEEEEEQQPQYRFRVRNVGMRPVK